MTIHRHEASTIVEMLDISWQDVPLRPETIAVWVGELTDPQHVFDADDAYAAIKFLLNTERRRPAYAEFVQEARTQHRVRTDDRLSPPLERLPELNGSIETWSDWATKEIG